MTGVVEQILLIVDAAYEQAAVKVRWFQDERVGQLARARQQVVDTNLARDHVQIQVTRLFEALALQHLVQRVFHVTVQVGQRRQRRTQPPRDRDIAFTEIQDTGEVVLVQQLLRQLDQIRGQPSGKVVQRHRRDLFRIGDLAGFATIGNQQRGDALGNQALVFSVTNIADDQAGRCTH
ncbi:hypothetical protein D3C72_1766430 [compost metagenome]